MVALSLGVKQFWHDLCARRYRFRQANGMIFVAFLVVVAEPGRPWFMLGLTVCTLGEALRLWASGYVHKSRVLETRGPYALVRHPQYLGNCLLATGVSLAAGHPWAIAVWAVLVWLFYLPAIRREDEKLSRRFGQAWERWRRKTPALLPTHWPAGNPSLHLQEWSLLQSVRNGEPIWIAGIALGLVLVYVHPH